MGVKYKILFKGKPPIEYFAISRIHPDDQKGVPERALFNNAGQSYYRPSSNYLKPGSTFETEHPEFYTDQKLVGNKGAQKWQGWPEQFKNMGEVIPEKKETPSEKESEIKTEPESKPEKKKGWGRPKDKK